MVRHVKRKKYPDKYLEDSDDWDVYGSLERAWWVYSYLEAFGGEQLLDGGGLWLQDEADMTNYFTLKWRETVIEEHLKANEQQAANDQ